MDEASADEVGVADIVDEDEAGAANPMRAMGGLITILGVALIAKRLWDSMKDEVKDAEGLQGVGEPFVGHDEKQNV